jgi:OPA family sugar phosphate sensor protein UhpC-like MFS transporter
MTDPPKETAGQPTSEPNVPVPVVPYPTGTFPTDKLPAAAPPVEDKGSWHLIWQVATNPMVLLLGTVYFLIKPTRYAILFWGPKYVNARLGSGMAESGFISALFELAGPIGAFVAGMISDRLLGTRRVPVCVVCLVLLGAALFMFDRLPADRWVMGAGFFLIGLLLFAPDSLIAGAASVDFGTKRGASTASGLINGFGSTGAVIGGMAPSLNEKLGWGPIFMLLGAMSVLAALILLPRWNALPKPQTAK